MVWNHFLLSDSGYAMKNDGRREEMSENIRTKHFVIGRKERNSWGEENV
jgi:hypothetical protein